MAGGVGYVTIGGTTISVEIANTPLVQEQGLGGRSSLPSGSGMLFVFDHDDRWGIWMKNMQFPIDIVWVDKNEVITTIKQNVTPETYPNVFYPTSPSRYVIELPGGYTKKEGIAEGTKIVL